MVNMLQNPLSDTVIFVSDGYQYDPTIWIYRPHSGRPPRNLLLPIGTGATYHPWAPFLGPSPPALQFRT